MVFADFSRYDRDALQRPILTRADVLRIAVDKQRLEGACVERHFVDDPGQRQGDVVNERVLHDGVHGQQVGGWGTTLQDLPFCKR